MSGRAKYEGGGSGLRASLPDTVHEKASWPPLYRNFAPLLARPDSLVHREALMASGTPCRCLDRQGRAVGGVGGFDSRKRKGICQTEQDGFASTL